MDFIWISQIKKQRLGKLLWNVTRFSQVNAGARIQIWVKLRVISKWFQNPGVIGSKFIEV